MASIYLLLVMVGISCVPGAGKAPDDPAPRAPDSEAETAATLIDLPDIVSMPSALLVRVRDPDGRPVPDARVEVLGRGERTDEHGDAAFRPLPPGEATLTARARGYGRATRRLTLSDGAQLRVTLTLPPAQATPLDPEGALEIRGPELGLSLDAGGLIGMDGAPAGTGAQLLWGAPAASELGVAADADGRKVALEGHARLQIAAETPRGRALRVAEGQTLRWTGSFPTPAEGAEALALWELDPLTSIWVERPFSALTTRVEGPTTTFIAEISQLGDWALARATPRGCLVARPASCAGLEDLPLEIGVRVQGHDERHAVSALDPEPRFSDLPVGEATLELILGEVVVSTARARVHPGERCAEAVLAQDACSGLAVTLQDEGGCPASEATFTLLREGAGEPERYETSGVALLPDLEPGPWRVRATDPAGGASAEARVIVEPGALRAVALTLDGVARADTPGGCAPPPCYGAACDACLLVEVRDHTDARVADTPVHVYDPLDQIAQTNARGEVCLDVPDGVGRVLQVLAPGGFAAGVPLTIPGGCGQPETCAVRTLSTTELPVVPEGWTPLARSPRLLGWREPALSSGERSREDAAVGSFLVARPIEDADTPLPPLACADDVTATVDLDEDTTGMLFPAETVLTCEDARGQTITLSLAWTRAALGTGRHPLGRALDALTLSLGPGEGAGTSPYERRWEASEGHIEIVARGAGRMDLILDITLSEEGSGARSRSLLVLSAPLRSAADTPRALSGLADRGTSGLFGLVEAVGAPQQRMFGPSGQRTSALDGGTPDDENNPIFSAPSFNASHLFGTLSQDYLRPVSARIEATLSMATSDGDAPEASATEGVYWMTRDLAEHLYRVAGEDPLAIDRGGTVFGVPARWSATRGALVPMEGLSTVVITSSSGERWTGTPLDQQLRGSAPGDARAYVFTALPPSAPGETYRLRLYGPDGAEVEEMRRTLTAVAGGVTVIGWEAMARE